MPGQLPQDNRASGASRANRANRADAGTGAGRKPVGAGERRGAGTVGSCRPCARVPRRGDRRRLALTGQGADAEAVRGSAWRVGASR